jgi:hypothetical protein
MTLTAETFVTALRAARTPAERAATEKRLGPDDEAFGVHMRDLFATAKAAKAMLLDEVAKLFASPLYEARMGAVCILGLPGEGPACR